MLEDEEILRTVIARRFLQKQIHGLWSDDTLACFRDTESSDIVLVSIESIYDGLCRIKRNTMLETATAKNHENGCFGHTELNKNKSILSLFI